ncbi:hypothetical protein KKF38_00605 [Patescibacteria group bacterium]|nr:hypothetical protein [Patescibacteria group bacterium]
MQNSTLSGAFDSLRKKHLRVEDLQELLEQIKKRIKRKIRPRKLKSLNEKQRANSKKSDLANLRLAVEFRKKMDAVKQNIRKSE